MPGTTARVVKTELNGLYCVYFIIYWFHKQTSNKDLKKSSLQIVASIWCRVESLPVIFPDLIEAMNSLYEVKLNTDFFELLNLTG